MTIQHPAKAILALLLVPWTAMSCSDESNDEKYRSEPPRFSDISIRPLESGAGPIADNGSGNLPVGQRLLVTAHQSAIGRLLYKATYEWTTSPSEDVSHRYSQKVVYDDMPVDPTDTIIVSAPGTYRINLAAKYYTSGQVTTWGAQHGTGFTDNFADGNGSATYTLAGILYFTVNASKTFTVEAQ